MEFGLRWGIEAKSSLDVGMDGRSNIGRGLGKEPEPKPEPERSGAEPNDGLSPGIRASEGGKAR